MVRFSEVKLYDVVMYDNKQVGIVTGIHRTTKRDYFTVSYRSRAYNRYCTLNITLDRIHCRLTKKYYLEMIDPKYEFKRGCK